jgi:nitroimidazol reductase NimA-like FMN-containing flavoprotein (pyridoxamine 5'-phosphate oxidase superfamily)
VIEILDMSGEEVKKLLERVGYGHLACALDDRPYVVPIGYVYESPHIYIYTTEGRKTDILNVNPYTCLQVEEVVEKDEWRSVIILGIAKIITDVTERERIVKLIRSQNPSLTPAISIRWTDSWIRENKEVIYRIEPDEVTGRSTIKVKISAVAARPSKTPEA